MTREYLLCASHCAKSWPNGLIMLLKYLFFFFHLFGKQFFFFLFLDPFKMAEYFLVQVSPTFQKFGLWHFAFKKDLYQFQFLPTERNLKRISVFMKRQKVKSVRQHWTCRKPFERQRTQTRGQPHHAPSWGTMFSLPASSSQSFELCRQSVLYLHLFCTAVS